MSDRDHRVKQTDRYVMVMAVVAVIATAAVYLSALAGGFIGYGDDALIKANPFLNDLTAANLQALLARPLGGLYQPVTMLSLAIDRWIWGFDPLGYHLTNVLLHLINTVLVFWITRALVLAVNGARQNLARTAAFVTALLFGLHPLHVEPVAWAAQRNDLLYSLFYLLAIALYLKHATQSREGASRLWLLFTALAFILSLLSSPMAVTLPLVLILADYYPLGRMGPLSRAESPSQTRAVWIEKWPFFAFAVAVAVAAIAARQLIAPPTSSGETAAGLRPLVAIGSYMLYLGKAIVPENLTLAYPPAGPDHIEALIGLSALVAVAGIAYWLRRRCPAIGTALAFYLIALVPVMFGAPTAADRHAYLPLLGPFMLVGLALGWINDLGDRGWRPTLRAVAGVVSAGAVFAIAFTTLRQIETWRDGETVWTHHLAIYPESATGHFCLGRYYERTGRIERAERQYAACIEADPSHFEANTRWGLILLDKGEFRAALSRFSNAVGTQPDNPVAHNNLGQCLLPLNRAQEALRHFVQAVKMDPSLVDARVNLGRAHEQIGNTYAAREQYERAVAMAPGNALAHERLGVCLVATGDRARAREEFSTAIKLDRKVVDARIGLAEFEVADGHPFRALGYLSTAAQLRPRDANLHIRKAKIVEANGAMGLAESSFRQATRVDPDNYRAHFELGLFLEKTDRTTESLEVLSEAMSVLQRKAIEANDNQQGEESLSKELQEAINRVTQKASAQ